MITYSCGHVYPSNDASATSVVCPRCRDGANPDAYRFDPLHLRYNHRFNEEMKKIQERVKEKGQYGATPTCPRCTEMLMRDEADNRARGGSGKTIDLGQLCGSCWQVYCNWANK